MACRGEAMTIRLVGSRDKALRWGGAPFEGVEGKIIVIGQAASKIGNPRDAEILVEILDTADIPILGRLGIMVGDIDRRRLIRCLGGVSCDGRLRLIYHGE